MSTVITLIQPKEIVNSGIVKAVPLNVRFDASILSPNIYLAEDRFLKTFICKAFYDDLVAQKNPTPSNYNAALGAIVQAYPLLPVYEFLWTEYILPYLSMAVYFQSIPDITVQSGSNGLFENNTDFGQNIGISGMKYVMDLKLQTIESRKAIIIKYLCDNKDLFPLFCYKEVCGDCGENKQSEGINLGVIFY